MDWLWDLLRHNPWLALILLGVVGQLFTPNPKKRRAAQRSSPPTDPQPTRTDPDEVAERIRELFAGKVKPTEPVVPVETYEPLAVVETYEPVQTDEIAASHRTVAGTYFDPYSIGETSIGKAPIGQTAIGVLDVHGESGRKRQALALAPLASVRALLILGPPRSLAPYDQDPLLSIYQRAR